MGVIHGPLYNNEYSMNFDGTDEYLVLGPWSGITSGSTTLNPSNAISISFWFKTSENQAYRNIFSYQNHTLGMGYYASTQYSTLRFGINLDGINRILQTNPSIAVINDGKWHHYLLIRTGNPGYVKIYMDGILHANQAGWSGDITYTYPITHTMGWTNNAPLYFLIGQVDEYAIWSESDQSANVATIYNNGKPNNIGNLPEPPTAWWRLGDNGAFKFPQWLLPQNSNKDKVSNYSMSFDGSDGNVRIGPTITPPSPSLGLTLAMSISVWAKKTGPSALEALVTEDESGLPNRNWNLFLEFDFLKCLLWNADGTSNFIVDPLASRIHDGNWHHVMFTYDGTTDADGMKLWVDGVNIVSKTALSTGISTSTATPFIGAIGWNGTGWNWNGNLDEVSVWDSVKTITDVSDNNLPIDLTGKSNLVGWWKMGDMAYSGGTADIWVVPDSSTNNHTGFAENQDIEDRVGEAPSSTNNGLSYNMELNDRVNDTPG